MADLPVERARRRRAARLLRVRPSRLATHDLPGLDATLLTEPVRGGGSLIVAGDGSLLFFGSAVPSGVAIEEFRSGRRTRSRPEPPTPLP